MLDVLAVTVRSCVIVDGIRTLYTLTDKMARPVYVRDTRVYSRLHAGDVVCLPKVAGAAAIARADDNWHQMFPRARQTGSGVKYGRLGQFF